MYPDPMHRLTLILTLALASCGGDSDPTVDASTDPTPDTHDTVDSTPDTTPTDPRPDEENACTLRDGLCVSPVAGCTRCPDGYMPSHFSQGCEPDWCCEPGTPGTTDCESAGGVCIPVIPMSACAPGWHTSSLECTGDGSGCCVPSDACA